MQYDYIQLAHFVPPTLDMHAVRQFQFGNHSSLLHHDIRAHKSSSSGSGNVPITEQREGHKSFSRVATVALVDNAASSGAQRNGGRAQISATDLHEIVTSSANTCIIVQDF